MNKKDEVILALVGGMHPTDIADEVGIAVSTVYKWAAEGGYLEQIKAERDQQVAAAYEGGMPVSEIFEDFGIAPPTLYAILAFRGIELRYDMMTRDDEMELIRLYKAGVRIRDIEKQTGRGRYTIYQTLHKYNVRLRRYSRRQGR